jgi:hypothetical protein
MKKNSKWTGANPWVNNILTLLEPTCDKPVVTTSIEWYMGVEGIGGQVGRGREGGRDGEREGLILSLLDPLLCWCWCLSGWEFLIPTPRSANKNTR